jgi:hypothetical protein
MYSVLSSDQFSHLCCDAETGKRLKAGSLKMNTALEYSTRVVQEGGRRCKKSTLNYLVHLTPLRIPLMNPPPGSGQWTRVRSFKKDSKPWLKKDWLQLYFLILATNSFMQICYVVKVTCQPSIFRLVSNFLSTVL